MAPCLLSSVPLRCLLYQGNRYRGGGGLVRAYFGKAKFSEGKFWFKILNTMENVVQTFQIMGNAGFDLGICSLEVQ